MTYLEDTLTGAHRKFDESIPKEARKLKVFLTKAKKFGYDEDENKYTSVGRRWVKSTKAKYDKWAKSTQAIPVESSEVE